MEQGCGIGPAKDRSRPADILIPNWSLSRSAAIDIKVIHPLNNSLISDADQTSAVLPRYIAKCDVSRLIFIHFAAIFTIHVYENQHS